MNLNVYGREQHYLDQTGRGHLTPKQRRRADKKMRAEHVECREGREWDGSPTGRCVICGRADDDFLTTGSHPSGGAPLPPAHTPPQANR